MSLAWDLTRDDTANTMGFVTIGPYHLNLLDLKTLDLTMSPDHKNSMEEAGYSSTEGWLNDNVSPQKELG